MERHDSLLPGQPSGDNFKRRRFLKTMAGTSLLGLGVIPAISNQKLKFREAGQSEHIRGLLLSATTVPGGKSMGHALDDLAGLFQGRRELLLINFASLPGDRDAYERRMQREFSAIDPNFKVRSLHRIPSRESAGAIRNAEGFFVSGGNTFLLLRELYDRYVLETLRERILMGVPYAGSSAGSNIAGAVIGTTNDFPITDIPTRRSLGIIPAVFNPHHPDPDLDKRAFDSRQWKMGQYSRYNENEVVLGVTDPGLVVIKGRRMSLGGEGGKAYLTFRGRTESVGPGEPNDLSEIIEKLTTATSGRE